MYMCVCLFTKYIDIHTHTHTHSCTKGCFRMYIPFTLFSGSLFVVVTNAFPTSYVNRMSLRVLVKLVHPRECVFFLFTHAHILLFGAFWAIHGVKKGGGKTVENHFRNSSPPSACWCYCVKLRCLRAVIVLTIAPGTWKRTSPTALIWQRARVCVCVDVTEELMTLFFSAFTSLYLHSCCVHIWTHMWLGFCAVSPPSIGYRFSLIPCIPSCCIVRIIGVGFKYFPHVVLIFSLSLRSPVRVCINQDHYLTWW